MWSCSASCRDGRNSATPVYTSAQVLPSKYLGSEHTTKFKTRMYGRDDLYPGSDDRIQHVDSLHGQRLNIEYLHSS
jgi:hypothetical protein